MIMKEMTIVMIEVTHQDILGRGLAVLPARVRRRHVSALDDVTFIVKTSYSNRVLVFED